MSNKSVDISAYEGYATARLSFLASIGQADSCRDPLAEFSEQLVVGLVGGTLAASRVQRGFDVVSPSGRRIQVKYLANPSEKWRNEHLVCFTPDNDDYAIVFFEGFRLQCVLLFQHEHLAAVCSLLKKKHPRQDTELQLTRTNYQRLLTDTVTFEPLGVRAFHFGTTGSQS